MDRLCVSPVLRIGLTLAHFSVLFINSKQGITSLSLLVSTTVELYFFSKWITVGRVLAQSG